MQKEIPESQQNIKWLWQIVFPKNDHNNFHTTCPWRTLLLPHQEVEAMSFPPEPSLGDCFTNRVPQKFCGMISETVLEEPRLWRAKSLNVCAPIPANSYVEILTPNVMVVGGGAFARWNRSWRWIPHELLVHLYKRPQRALYLFLPCEGTTRNWQSRTQKRALMRNWPCWLAP